jgi:hypothetical protein
MDERQSAVCLRTDLGRECVVLYIPKIHGVAGVFAKTYALPASAAVASVPQ